MYWNGIEVVLANIDRIKADVAEAAERQINVAVIALQASVATNIGFTDHSLRDLKNLGHPYSKSNPSPIHNPDWIVHKQSGVMSSGLNRQTRKTPKGNIVGKVGFSAGTKAENTAKHVIYGTRRMVGRDFLNGTLTAEADRLGNIMRDL